MRILGQGSVVTTGESVKNVTENKEVVDDRRGGKKNRNTEKSEINTQTKTRLRETT